MNDSEDAAVQENNSIQRRAAMNVLTVGALLTGLSLFAQDTTLPLPQFDEVFYRFEPAAGKLIDLERQVAAAESKPKALGLAGYKVSFYLRGAESPVRFREGGGLEFVFSLPPRVDPQTVQFIALRKSGNRREFVQAQTNRPSTFGAGTARDVSDRSAVPYEIQKYAGTAYKLIPSKPLPAGEYAFSLPTNNITYSFGIDSPGR